MARNVQERGFGKEQVNEPKVHLVQRHLVGEPSGALRHDAELPDPAQIMIAQIIEVLAVIAHPQFASASG